MVTSSNRNRVTRISPGECVIPRYERTLLDAYLSRLCQVWILADATIVSQVTT